MEIIYELLSLAKTDIKKTRLMYQSNLCYSHFNRYIDFLRINEFINLENEKPNGFNYKITEKGFEFIERFNYILELFNK